MNTPSPPDMADCDVLVLGSGAGGLACAVTAAHAGLKVIVAEKEPVFGGTMAYSGGVLWIPGNPHCPAAASDTREAAREYLRHECGAFFDAEAVDAFLDAGPEMVRWFERETQVQFVPTLYPDYHPAVPGGVDIGRSILARPFDIRALGADMARLRPPLATITFIGMMFNSSNADLKHFFQATKSLRSAAYVARRLALHLVELARYGRGVQVTSGNALAARLAASALKAGVPIWTDSPALRLIEANGRVQGAVLRRGGAEQPVRARLGVVLATGGFAHDAARIAQAYPHVARGGTHLSPVPSGNTGDGVRLGESVGGAFQVRLANAAAWMPVSRVPGGGADGRGDGVFPHLLDRYKPGVIAVTARGERFCNESESYHDVGAAMIEACRGQRDTRAWLVCDQAALARYGLGVVKPAPVPIGAHLRSGYLKRGATLAELAAACGIDAAALQRTVQAYNGPAARGEDPQFGRGRTSFNRYLADPAVQPNPCVAPLLQAPFYAVELQMGDLGTFDGLRTSVQGEVLTASGAPVPGLFAAGNDRASVMGGNYPGAGITLGPHLTFGWLTARHLAQLAGSSHAHAEQRHAA